MLIAEDLLLLLTDEERGTAMTDATKVTNVLAGAVLLELAMAGRVDVAEPDSKWKRSPRLTVTDAAPFGTEVLDDALASICEHEGKKPQDVLGKLAKDLRQSLRWELTSRGVLREEKHRIIGVFPTTRWHIEDAHYVRRTRDHLRACLTDAAPLDDRSGALISLLSAIDAAPKVMDPDKTADRKVLRERAKHMANQSWASGAVKRAVNEVNTATMTAIAATGAAAAGGS